MRMTQKQRDKPGMPDSLVRERHSELKCACDVEGAKKVKNKRKRAKPIKVSRHSKYKNSESETDSAKI